METTFNEINISYSRKESISNTYISSSSEAFQYLMKCWNSDTIELYEEFKLILLNNAAEVLGVYPVSKGGITSTVVEIKHIIFVALKTNSTSIILAHNHPSGNLKPSSIDIKITERINEACKIMDLKLTDHLIITKRSYFSFMDEGYL